jgi:hypothetical protein
MTDYRRIPYRANQGHPQGEKSHWVVAALRPRNVSMTGYDQEKQRNSRQ